MQIMCIDMQHYLNYLITFQTQQTLPYLVAKSRSYSHFTATDFARPSSFRRFRNSIQTNHFHDFGGYSIVITLKIWINTINVNLYPKSYRTTQGIKTYIEPCNGLTLQPLQDVRRFGLNSAKPFSILFVLNSF